MRTNLSLVVVVAAAACSRSAPADTAAVDAGVATPATAGPVTSALPPPLVPPTRTDPFGGCRVNRADPRWFLIGCNEGPSTTTLYATRGDLKSGAQIRTYLEGYAKGMQKDGAETVDDLGPVGAVRTTYTPQGSTQLRVTLTAAWKPDGQHYADVTCVTPVAYEPHCRELLARLGSTGLPASVPEDEPPAPVTGTQR